MLGLSNSDNPNKTVREILYNLSNGEDFPVDLDEKYERLSKDFEKASKELKYLSEEYFKAQNEIVRLKAEIERLNSQKNLHGFEVAPREIQYSSPEQHNEYKYAETRDIEKHEEVKEHKKVNKKLINSINNLEV